jgi:hypothetical protein
VKLENTGMVIDVFRVIRYVLNVQVLPTPNVSRANVRPKLTPWKLRQPHAFICAKHGMILYTSTKLAVSANVTFFGYCCDTSLIK